MCRNLEKVGQKNLQMILERMNSSKKCLIVNTTPSPLGKATNPLIYYGAGGYDLTKADSKEKAKIILTGLVSLPETKDKVFCKLI